MAKPLQENFPAQSALAKRIPLFNLKLTGLCAAAFCLGVGQVWALEAETPLPDLGHKATRLTQPLVGKKLGLVDLEGKTRTLKEFAGKVVLVNFWASWCPPCRREMPSMERLYQRLKGEPFVVLAVDQYEKPDMVFAFTGELDPQPTFPILLDTSGEVSRAWRVQGIPTSFLVDKRGRVVYRAVGGRDFEHPEMEKLARDLMLEK